MNNYIWSSEIINEINKDIDDNILLNNCEIISLYQLDWLKKIEWIKSNPKSFNIYLKNFYKIEKQEYFRIKENFEIDDNWEFAIFNVIFKMNDLLIQNFEKEYLLFTKMIIFVNEKEVFNLDFQFIFNSILSSWKTKKIREDIIVGFIKKMIEYYQKLFFESDKIEIFFFTKEDYYKN